ncbi:MAG: DNA-directed RNA polymerase subunit beta, partial [Dethiosulfovibrio sp.]|nr:DNA-directed RNA polymerase subunit beta [Dethiosulfovibrio sp.]
MAEFVPVGKKRSRLTFGRARDLVEIPDMVEVQRDSYVSFFQEDRDPDDRESIGLQELLDEIFPIESYDGSFSLEFVRYYLDRPTTTQEDAQQKDCTWHRPVRATIRLINRKTMEIKEEEIFLGDFPMMTERGTFIINGTERVVVNQLARSAGVYFKVDYSAPAAEIYTAKIIPDRGAWLEFAMGSGDTLYINIDSRKKLPGTLLLKAFGVSSNEELLRAFDGEIEEVDLSEEDLLGRLLAENIVNDAGNVVIRKENRIGKEQLEILWEMNRSRVKVWKVSPVLAATLEKDVADNTDEAMLEIFRRLRPNEPARIENAKEYFDTLFFDPRRYTLGRVGRYKLNRRLKLDVPMNERLLTVD